MKEKISSKIKELLKGKNLANLSEKTIDDYCSNIAGLVTEETQLTDAFYNAHLAVLSSMNGQIYADTAAKVEAAKKNPAPAPAPAPIPTPAPAPSQDDELSKKLAKIEAAQAALDAKILAKEKSEHDAKILSQANEIMKSKGSTNDFIRNITLKGITIGETDTAESIAEKYKTVYDANFKEAYGNGGVPPRGMGNPQMTEKADFTAEVERLKASGKIPAAK